VLFILSIITALIWMLIPQLFKSVEDMIAAYPKNSQKFYIILDKLLTDNSDIAGTVLSYYNQWSKSIEEFIKRTLLPNLSDYIKVFSSGIYSFVREIFNFLVKGECVNFLPKLWIIKNFKLRILFQVVGLQILNYVPPDVFNG